MNSPIFECHALYSISAKKHIPSFWSDLSAVTEDKIWSDKMDTSEQIKYEIDSHLVLLGVHQIWIGFNQNTLFDVMVDNMQEMKKVDRSITDVSDQKM